MASGSPKKEALLEQHRKLDRTMSVVERDGIKLALDAVQEEADELQELEGLSQVSFFLGVVNVPVVCLTLAWRPDMLWVLYGAECLVLIPAWLINMHKVYQGSLFILDFCWVVNTCFAIYMAVLYFDHVPESWKRTFFVTFFSIACGPLAWACILLHNGLIFHSIAKITSLFIHMIPALVAWSIVTFPDDVEARWPGRFISKEEMSTITLKEVYFTGLSAYAVWWVLHSAWLLTIGVGLDPQQWNTVFEDLYQKQGLGPAFTKKFGCSSKRAHGAIYLIIHFLLDMLAFVFPVICWQFYYVHTGFCVGLFLSAAWSGAGYYNFLLTKKYKKVVEKILVEKDKAHEAKRRQQQPLESSSSP